MNKRTRNLLISGISLLAVGAIGTVWATTSVAAEGRYVTAAATTGDVSQSFLASGTITRENLVEAAFSVTGTVKKLKVGVGDTVAAGDVLATLDTSALKLALLNAETDLASAKANLYAAENPSSSSSGSGGSGGSRASSSAGSGSSTGDDSSAPGAPSGITASDAATLYEAIAAVNVATLKWSNSGQPTTCDLIYTALLNANAAEPETTDPETTDPETGGSENGEIEAGSGETGTDEGAEEPGDSSDSEAGGESAPEESATENDSATTADSPADTEEAGKSDQAAETGDDTEQLALMVDDITLEDIKECGQARQDLLLANAVLTDYYQQLITTGTIAGEGEPENTNTGSTPSAPSSGSGGSSGSAGSSAGSTSVSARAVASAEADVLRAQQAVDAAETDLASAELTAPIAGTVGAIGLSAGASSTGGAVTIVGEGTALVSIEAPLATRTLLSQGMTATVTPAGAVDSLAGTVSNISVLETSGTAGDSPTYTTTIAVDDPGLILKEGAGAGVEIITATASGVVTAPASAVTPTGAGTGTVQVIESSSSDAAETVTVATGAVGGGRVEITDGLEDGQLVVLLDRTASIDSLTSSTTSTRRTAGFAIPR